MFSICTIRISYSRIVANLHQHEHTNLNIRQSEVSPLIHHVSGNSTSMSHDTTDRTWTDNTRAYLCTVSLALFSML